MLDRSVRRIIDPWLEIPAGALARRRIAADTVTVAGFLIGMAGCGAIAFGHPLIGLILLLLNRTADGLDGCIARRSGHTDVGGFLDFVLDVVFYGGVPFSFALRDSTQLLPACFLIYSFLGTIGSFLTFAAISAKRGVTSDLARKKSFYYSAGLMEGTETVIFFTLFCLFPEHFAPLAWTFAILCWITTAVRVATGVILFREAARSSVGESRSVEAL